MSTIAEVQRKLHELEKIPEKGVEIMKVKIYDSGFTKRTGRLEASINAKQVGEEEWSVGTEVMSEPQGWEKSFRPFPYAKVVAYGRKTIKMPENAWYGGKVYPLRWGDQGQVYSMHSSEVTGNDFPKHTAEALREWVRSIFS